MKYLIDGYNLIFECGLHGKRINGQTVAMARQRLLQELESHLPAPQHTAVTVVFDASRKMIRDELAEEYFGNIKVLYSINFDDADEMIEHLIGQHSAPGRLIVVSSDHRLHKAALRRKAKPIDCGDWYDALIEGKLSLQEDGEDALPPAESLSDKVLSADEIEKLKQDVENMDG